MVHSPRGDLLGFSKTPILESRRFLLKKGDTIVLYTDGIFEQYNRPSEKLNLKRLQKLCRSKSPQEIVDAVRNKMQEQWTLASPKDDCACLALRFDSVGLDPDANQEPSELVDMPRLGTGTEL